MNNSSIPCPSLVFSEAVPLMTAMTSKLKVFLLLPFLLGFDTSSDFQKQGIGEVLRKIFLAKQFNSTESEEILISARESFLFLKDVEREFEEEKKLNFARNYANFLLKLLNELQTKDVDIHELFTKENLFLKGYNSSQVAGDFNATELRTNIENVQFAIEQHLVSYYNSSDEWFEASKILALNKTNFDAFLKEKLRADYTQTGYFLLEVFATLIGLSWGVISTLIYYTGTHGMSP